MKNKKLRSLSVITLAALLSVAAVGCSNSQVGSEDAAATTKPATSTVTAGSAPTAVSTATSTTKVSTSELFSDRDLKQSADLATATTMKLVSNQDVTLNKEGIYVLSGEVDNVTVVIDAADDAKVQIVLDGVSITNEDSPAIYVKGADKVFVTTTGSKNHMEVSGSYVADGETNLDAVIFSKADMTLNGTGTLDIVSKSGNGISSKDDLKITGGVYTIQSSADAIEANDAILINDGTITINSAKDGLHSENDEDASKGYIYIEGGTLKINAADDAIRGNSFVQIDGGIINIESSEEGIEANSIKINDGQITLYAKNDGINASSKVNSDVVIEVNGGTIHVKMASGDTDAFDSNGNLYINGGTIDVEAVSAFDADGTAQLNGGNVTVNGEKITQITQSRGGGGRGGAGGGMGTRK
ncbi:carbohydrate-binding domain-containing protein [Paenibacillus qinlingensis]|uniref:carbohydrate-binding domain-containing protein n=1 Tax=Paenibacillus qinlingensis TaxID=1837343 RepID=UPI001564DD56|nr:carbohydrate-binding domain-containing protein [Paenibacillus qinlingensis]NQX62873.1 carbohydrate-binding domain-containing protein [Paenibacillus qinlingensis]